MKDKYTITIFWSDEDDAYIGIVEELKGCSAWGDSYEDALRELKIAMQLWLEVAKEEGFPVPEPKGYREVA